MSASNFHAVPKVPDSVAHLDPDVVVELLSRHGVNVSEAASELGVASADLRRLLWANPRLTDAAVELEERRLDLAERNIFEALKSNDPRRRDAAAMFTIRNSHRARRRGWITTSTSVAELAISDGASGPREVVFRWRSSDDDKREAEAAERERLEAEGKTVVSIGWEGPATETFERDGKTFTVPKYSDCGDDAIEGEVVTPPALIEHAEPPPAEPPASPTPEPPQLPVWRGVGGPPPLVQHLYQPWVEPRRVRPPQLP